MSGIFYDPAGRRLHAVTAGPQPGWTLVTHNLDATIHQCRRIMREWVPSEELFRVDWSIHRERLSA